VARQREHGGPRGHDCRSERDCHRRGRLGLIPDFDRKVRRAADQNISSIDPVIFILPINDLYRHAVSWGPLTFVEYL
jgi:hypothetical protein